eukprot:502342-Pyramimonas_sp.AAC.1
MVGKKTHFTTLESHGPPSPSCSLCATSPAWRSCWAEEALRRYHRTPGRSEKQSRHWAAAMVAVPL